MKLTGNHAPATRTSRCSTSTDYTVIKSASCQETAFHGQPIHKHRINSVVHTELILLTDPQQLHDSRRKMWTWEKAWA
ncbi:hypothetical protein AOLI_G00194370 [Acnodon oligacanthus]